jgi:hypothetical protein
MTRLFTLIARIANRRTPAAALIALAAVGGSALALGAATPKPGFSVTASPDRQTVYPGDSASYTVALQRSGGFSGPVALAVTGLPSGASATFTPASVPSNGTSSSLTILTGDTSAPGNYKLSITGTGASGSSSQEVRLDVDKPAFTVSGNLATPLPLGGTGESLDLALSNPTNKPLTVSGITVALAATSVAACPTSQFSVAQIPASYAVTVPARSSQSLTQLGSRYLPRITWVDSRDQAQNSCLGAKLSFSYSATGQR